jgi:hypothetical protein
MSEVENANVEAPEEPVVATEEAGTEQEVTATPVDGEQEPEQPTEGAPRLFTQEEVDAFVEKRLARAERARQRQLQQPSAVTPQTDGFDTDGNPLTPEQIIQQYEAARQEESIREAYSEREEEALERYPDFEQVAYRKDLPVSDDMARAIRASDKGPDVLYWLGTNPKEAARIARLPAFVQAKEIGRIEERISSNPPAKKTTSAPPPITPIAAPNGAPRYDTTDPRSISQMSTSDWIEAERARQRAKLERQRNSR